MTWSFHVDELQKNSRYDMIIGWNLLLELKLDLCFSDYTINGNGCAYEGCTTLMRDTSNLRDDTSFRNEKWWKSEHVIDYTRRTHRILDKKDQKSDLIQIVSNNKHLNNNEQSMLRDVWTKYELAFGRTLWTWKTRPVDRELQPGEKPYHDEPYPVTQAHTVVFLKEVEQLCQTRVLKILIVQSG